MTTKTTYVATAPDGTEITRTTTSRTYTHAVLAHDERGWGYLSFNGRADLAYAEAAKWAGHRFDQVLVVEVVERSRREVKPRTAGAAGSTCPGSVKQVTESPEWDAKKHGTHGADTFACPDCGQQIATVYAGLKFRSHRIPKA